MTKKSGSMKFDMKTIHSLASRSSFSEFDSAVRSLISGLPVTQVIPGELTINIELIEDRTLFPEMFAKYQEVVSYFDKRFYKEKDWLECYDKLIRIDKCNEESILYIVKYFRNDEFWRSNFITLLKLRRLNKEKIKYIDYFKEKIKSDYDAKSRGFATGNIIQKTDGKKRDY
jgi:hypothetical protein